MYGKKLIVLVFLFLVSLVGVTLASTPGLEKKVFELRSYDYDNISNSYSVSAYGSAVLIDTNKVITNAHVILDENEEVGGNYELCKTISFEKPPKCFSTLKLLSYDMDNDLAILEILSPTGLSTPVSKSSKKLNIGDSVRIYGYPANGGATITFTEGKVSGYTEGFYKVDANMDAGNSGGGAFDEDGKLMGISAAVSVGYTTLGLIIPIDKVNTFLKGTGDITEYTESPSIEFRSYIKSIQSIINGKYSISDRFFSVKNLNKYGFYVSEASSTVDKKLSEYTLEPKDINNKTVIYISTKGKYGKSFSDEDINRYAKLIDKELKEDSEEGVKRKTKNFNYKGNNISLYLSYEKEDNSIFLSLKTPNVSYVILTSLDEMASIKKAFYIFLKEITFKKIANYNNTVKFGDLEIDIDDAKAKESIFYNKKELSIVLDTEDFHILELMYETHNIEDTEDYSFSEYVTAVGEMINKYMTTIQVIKSEILKTDNGFYYAYMTTKYADNETKNLLSYSFFVKNDTDITYYTFSTKDTDNKSIKTKIEKIINSIKVNGELGFNEVGTVGNLEVEYNFEDIEDEDMEDDDIDEILNEEEEDI